MMWIIVDRTNKNLPVLLTRNCTPFNKRFVVGYCLAGELFPLREFDTLDEAERHVHYLNGGN